MGRRVLNRSCYYNGFTCHRECLTGRLLTGNFPGEGMFFSYLVYFQLIRFLLMPGRYAVSTTEKAGNQTKKGKIGAKGSAPEQKRLPPTNMALPDGWQGSRGPAPLPGRVQRFKKFNGSMVGLFYSIFSLNIHYSIFITLRYPLPSFIFPLLSVILETYTSCTPGACAAILRG